VNVSLIIRCYNEEQHIGRLLSGIMQQTIQDVEIIVVDSGSTDATLSIASRYPVEILSIRPGEFSFGRSLNMGCQAASGEFVVIASAHVYPVYKDWLERLLAPLADPQVALAYGKQRGHEITQYAEQRVFAQWFPEQSNLCQKHPFCNNANAAIRRALWEQLPYDEALTGLEDLDWAKRAIALGHHLAYVAEAEVVHVHNETPRQTYNRYRREAIAFKRIFPQEQFRFWDFVWLWAANVFSDYKHALRDRVQRRELLAIPRFRLMQFWGTYHGYAQHTPVSQQLRRTFYYPNHWRPGPTLSENGRAEIRIRYDKVRGPYELR
jgi:glycosyltransferase involved in cell wall biosynthesis